jgi:hypothetical protein
MGALIFYFASRNRAKVKFDLNSNWRIFMKIFENRKGISLLLLAMGRNLFFPLEPAQLAFLFSSPVQPNPTH